MGDGYGKSVVRGTVDHGQEITRGPATGIRLHDQESPAVVLSIVKPSLIDLGHRRHCADRGVDHGKLRL
jgi:hypothetical protein